MSAGRLDAAFFDQITGQSTLIEKHPKKYRQAGPELTSPKKYFGDGFGIAFRKNEQSLADKFNKALAQLKRTAPTRRSIRSTSTRRRRRRINNTTASKRDRGARRVTRRAFLARKTNP